MTDIKKLKQKAKKLKVALVHDYLREYGGAERVLEALHETFPDAPVYTAFTDPQVSGIHWQKFQNWKIYQSWLTKIPFHKKIFSPLRIFAPQYFETFDLSEYDVVISSSNAYFAKAVRVRSDAVHICYCHTPARSLYGYSTMTDWKKNPVIRVFGTLINHYLRVIDVKVAQRVNFFIANSIETQRRIQKFYRRDSTVIFPPVNVPSESPSTQERTYFLYVNRLSFSKHPELAVEACTNLNLPLKVVGAGKMSEKLPQLAGPKVEFLGAVSDQKLHELYAGAQALIYPVEDEDFGIVPIEAMGHGVPVIAHRSGGPQETIIDGSTGIFFDELDVAGVKAAIQKYIKYADTFDRKRIHQHALQFSKQKFQANILDFVQSAVKK